MDINRYTNTRIYIQRNKQSVATQLCGFNSERSEYHKEIAIQHLPHLPLKKDTKPTATAQFSI